MGDEPPRVKPDPAPPAPAADAAAADPADNEAITLKLVDQDGGNTSFKVKKSFKLQKVFHAYATRMGLDLSVIKFLFDGQRLLATSTVGEAALENNDQIDVVTQQTGGY